MGLVRELSGDGSWSAQKVVPACRRTAKNDLRRNSVLFRLCFLQSLLSINDEKTEDEDELEDDYDFGTKG